MKTQIHLEGDWVIAVGTQMIWACLLALLGILIWSALVVPVQAAAGDLDPTFGTAGKVTTDFFGLDDNIFAIAIQPGGKIVAAGIAQVSSENSDFALARYNKNGSLDTDFGDGGKVTTDFFGFGDAATAVALQPGGKIVAVGGAGFEFALARYNKDGSLDTDFGDGGKVTTDFFGHVDIATAVVLQGGGRIVAAGGSFNFTAGNDFALAGYDRHGSMDTSFGDGGKVTTDFFGGVVDSANAIVIQPGGGIVAVGGAGGGSSGILDFGVARYNKDGSVDTDFGDGGKVTTDFFSTFDEATAVALQSPGNIVVVGGFTLGGSAGADFALARYLSKGPNH